MLLKKINFYILSLFVFSLPFTAFSIFQIGRKDIIFSWFLIFLLTLINIPRIRRASKIIVILYVWLVILFLSIVKLEFLEGFMPAKGFTQLLMMVIMMVHLFVLSIILRKKPFIEIRKLINILFFSTFVLSVYTFYQYSSYFFSFFPQIDFFRNAEIYYIYKGTGVEGWSGTHRVYGVAPEPTFWASYLLLPLSFLLPYVFPFRKFLIKKFLFLVFFISLVLTFSRSGWVVFIMMLFIYPFTLRITPNLKICYSFIVLITIVFGGIIGDYLEVPFFSDLSFLNRINTGKVALEIFFDKPILGIGFGNFYLFSNNWFVLNHSPSSPVTHNFYLRLLAETGLCGFLIFLLFLGFLFQSLVKGYKHTKQTKNLEKIKFFQGLSLAFFSILISWLFGEGYNFSYIWFIFALILILPDIFKKYYD